MPQTPRLADVRCTKIKFDPGDKLIVRTNNIEPLDSQSIKKLKKTIEKWAGCDLDILIVQLRLMDIEIVKSNREIKIDNG